MFFPQSYLIRLRIAFFSKQFDILDMNKNKVFFVKQKKFALKEDIRVYKDDSMIREYLYLKAKK